MDLYDPSNYFTTYVPIRARTSSLLRYATAAVAAIHLGHLQGSESGSGAPFKKSAGTEAYQDNDGGTGWLRHAAAYYHHTVMLLRQALPHGFGGLQLPQSILNLGLPSVHAWPSHAGQERDPDSPLNGLPATGHGQSPGEKVDDLLATSSLLMIYSCLDSGKDAGREWMQ